MALELFHFEDIEGNDRTLPKTISAGAMRKARHEPTEMGMFFALLENAASPESLDALDALDLAAFGVVMTEWMQGATPKNSPSSSK